MVFPGYNNEIRTESPLWYGIVISYHLKGGGRKESVMHQMFGKSLVSAVLAVSLVVSPVLGTQAAGTEETASVTAQWNSKSIPFTIRSDGTAVLSYDNFDYDWYLEQHPDLAAITGDDKTAIFTFYQTTGEPNGWPGKLDPDVFPAYYFDAERYAEDNPDVAAAVGTSADALLSHYLNNGASEGRKAYSTDRAANAIIEAEEVLETIVTDDMTDREKVTAVNDWMVDNYSYDFSFSRYTYADTILDKTGICEGYAQAFEVFMTLLGIETQMVTGTADGANGWDAHAWNRTKIDGQWLYTDVTWNDIVLYGNGWTESDRAYYKHRCLLSADPNFPEADHQIDAAYLE